MIPCSNVTAIAYESRFIAQRGLFYCYGSKCCMILSMFIVSIGCMLFIRFVCIALHCFSSGHGSWSSMSGNCQTNKNLHYFGCTCIYIYTHTRNDEVHQPSQQQWSLIAISYANKNFVGPSSRSHMIRLPSLYDDNYHDYKDARRV